MLPEIDTLKEQSAKNKDAVENFSIRLSELAGRVDASYHVPIVMGLGIKCGDTITVQAEGEDEQLAIDAVKAYLVENKF